jgi:hypothetical protein
MKTKVCGLAMSAAIIALGAPLPASAQFFSNYPVIVVPPPAQNYVLPKPPKPPLEKPKPPDAPTTEPQPQQTYQGRTHVIDR